MFITFNYRSQPILFFFKFYSTYSLSNQRTEVGVSWTSLFSGKIDGLGLSQSSRAESLQTDDSAQLIGRLSAVPVD